MGFSSFSLTPFLLFRKIAKHDMESISIVDAIAIIIEAFDRYPEGIFLGKPPIAKAIEVLREVLKEMHADGF